MLTAREMIEKRLSHGGGEIVEFTPPVEERQSTGILRKGIVMWKRDNPHASKGKEYIIHQYFYREDDDEATFEVGNYIFNEKDANECYEKRSKRGY